MTGPAFVGFVGLGRIGAPMATRLLERGHRLLVVDAVAERVEPLERCGAVVARSVAEVAEQCEVVLTSLPSPAAQHEVVSGPGGLLAPTSARLRVHVDLSTSSMAAVQDIARAEEARGVAYVDAPVSGGPVKAGRGELSVMVSGTPASVAAAGPLLESLATEVFALGDAPGRATLAKLVNNVIFLGSGLIAQEAMLLATKGGLDPDVVLPVLRRSSASAYTRLLPWALRRDFDEVSFSLELADKDLRAVLDAAAELEVPMHVSEAAASVYAEARAGGHGAKNFLATLLALEEAAGVAIPGLEPVPVDRRDDEARRSA